MIPKFKLSDLKVKQELSREVLLRLFVPVNEPVSQFWPTPIPVPHFLGSWTITKLVAWINRELGRANPFGSSSSLYLDSLDQDIPVVQAYFEQKVDPIEVERLGIRDYFGMDESSDEGMTDEFFAEFDAYLKFQLGVNFQKVSASVGIGTGYVYKFESPVLGAPDLVLWLKHMETDEQDGLWNIVALVGKLGVYSVFYRHTLQAVDDDFDDLPFSRAVGLIAAQESALHGHTVRGVRLSGYSFLVVDTGSSEKIRSIKDDHYRVWAVDYLRNPSWVEALSVFRLYTVSQRSPE